MVANATQSPSIENPTRPYLPALMLLFVSSGCAALIYEIVWLQLLQLVIGSSAVSLGVLLGTFMGGMCLGSLLLPRIISPKQHPLRVYGLLELGIGIIGIAVHFWVPLVGTIYSETVGLGMPGILLRAVVAGVCLLPPTILMGATLPAIARYVRTTPQGISWLGLFYAGNIAGAVFGCLLAGFYLLRIYDMATATFVAAGINFTVGALALAVASKAPHQAEPDRDGSYISSPSPSGVYLAIALSGATALAGEVVWTRLLSLMLGATVYTFSIILAVFLVGLGIGSSVGAMLARSPSIRPRVALGYCQLALAVAVAWAAYLLSNSLGYWPITPGYSVRPWFLFQLDILRSAWVVLPGALLWGASFPLALAAVAGTEEDAGRVVGRLYATNTVGAILGSLLTSILLIKLLGTQLTQQIMIELCIVSGLLALAPMLLSWNRLARAGALVVVVALASGLALSVDPVPGLLIAFGRYLPGRGLVYEKGVIKDRTAELLYVGEGLNSSVAVTKTFNFRSFHISGRVEASSQPQDMRVQRMLGHVPALLHGKPESVLVVGCGAGVTAGSFITHPTVKRIVICELEPLIPQVVAQYFSKENYGVVQDITAHNQVHQVNGKTIEVIYDDARHFVATTRERFDIITSDPIHPWIKGSATLYTREYFDLVRNHLNPGGVVTQWVPLYESAPAVVQSECATFFEAFPDGIVWANDVKGMGYDIVLTAKVGWPQTIDVDEWTERLGRPEYAQVSESLRNVGFNSIQDLLSAFAGRGPDLAVWLANAEINRDRNLRLQYLAGLAFNAEQGTQIYQAIVANRKFPEGVIVGSETLTAPLKQTLASRR